MTRHLVALAIVATLRPGAVTKATGIPRAAISDAYERLKSLIKQQYGDKSDVVKVIEYVESAPDSTLGLEALEFVLGPVNADSNPTLLFAAQALLELVKALPEGEHHIQDTLDLRTNELEYIAQQAKLLLPTHEPTPEAWDNIETAIKKEGIGASSRENKAPMNGKARNDATIVQVFYATDRMRIPTIGGVVKYGPQRSISGKLHLGRCEVSIPAVHRIGKLETPSILRLEFRPDPKKHIVLSKTYSMAEHKFLSY
jgi:hypothetical protein